jgi:hypothetical protein
MNQQNAKNFYKAKSTQTGVSSHINYQIGTLTFTRYLNSAMMPPNARTTHREKQTKCNTPSASAKSNEVLTPNDHSTEKVHPHQDTNADQNDVTTPTVPNGFITASGNIITNKSSQPPFRVPYKNPIPVITPAMQNGERSQVKSLGRSGKMQGES